MAFDSFDDIDLAEVFGTSDTIDQDDAILTNKANEIIGKLVTPSVIDIISNAAQADCWYWNTDKTQCCHVGSGIAFVKLCFLTKPDFEKAIKSSTDTERLVAISESKWDKKYEKLIAAIYLERLSASSVYKQFYLVRYSELLDFVKSELKK